MKLLDEFKAFALKGSVIDLAVGVIIGAAFGKIVNSLISDIIMPPIGWLIGGVDFTSLKIAMPQQLIGNDPKIVYINYGNFIQTAFEFLIIAIAIFFVIKFIINMQRKDVAKVEPAPPAEPAPTKEELLLSDIRDILKNQNNITK
ncbi:MAG: large-conductance mechanosensitive channel protein MscL [Rikenellaceae bacterium]